MLALVEKYLSLKVNVRHNTQANYNFVLNILKKEELGKNPFRFERATVVVNGSVTREAITRAQERAFQNFIKNDACHSKYYDGIYILFHTGLRVSEFCGLTISDIDFKNKRIWVDH